MMYYLGVCPECGKRVCVTEDAFDLPATCNHCGYEDDPDVFVDEAIRIDGVDG